MSKKEKLYARLCATPPPRDFPWGDLVTLMRHFGFSESCSGGSHYIFEHESGRRLAISKTHPSGVLKRYQIEAAIEAITLVMECDGEKTGKK